MSEMNEERSSEIEFEIGSLEPGEEAEIVRVLREAMPGAWDDEAVWRWKHTDRPGFTPEDVITVKLDGTVVACYHMAIFPMQLEDGLVVEMGLLSDYAVVPAQRRRGITILTFDVINRRFLERGVGLRCGFTSPELHRRLYRKQFGHVFVPTIARQFRKVVGLGALRKRLDPLNTALESRPRLRAALERVPWVVNLDIQDLPSCRLEVSGEGVQLFEDHAEQRDLGLRIPYAAVASMADGPRIFLSKVLAAFLSGRLRVAGLAGATLRMSRVLAAMVAGPSRRRPSS